MGTPIFPRIESEKGEAGPTPGPQPKDEGSALPTSDRRKGAEPPPSDLIDITDFAKIDLRIAEIKTAEKVEGADRLLKLQVDMGGEMRQIVSGIALHYKPEELVGRKIVIVANLKPAKIRGVESHGMLLAASDAGGLSVVVLDRTAVSIGSRVK